MSECECKLLECVRDLGIDKIEGKCTFSVGMVFIWEKKPVGREVGLPDRLGKWTFNKYMEGVLDFCDAKYVLAVFAIRGYGFWPSGRSFANHGAFSTCVTYYFGVSRVGIVH